MKRIISSELWAQIEGYENSYLISDFGRVYSVERKVNHPIKGKRIVNGKIRKPSKDGDGYFILNLHKNGKKKTFRIHQLVIKHFGPSRPSAAHEVNHKDGDKTNNHIQNLEWVTPKENTEHAIAAGLRINQFTDIEVESIREIRKRYHFTYKEIAAAAGCCHKHIGKIIRKERYK